MQKKLSNFSPGILFIFVSLNVAAEEVSSLAGVMLLGFSCPLCSVWQFEHLWLSLLLLFGEVSRKPALEGSVSSGTQRGENKLR